MNLNVCTYPFWQCNPKRYLKQYSGNALIPLIVVSMKQSCYDVDAIINTFDKMHKSDFLQTSITLQSVS